MARYTHVNLIERFPNRISLAIAENPQISGYQLRGADTLNNSYGIPAGKYGVVGTGTSLILDVLAGEFFRSPTLARNRVGIVEESFREQTRIMFDLQDYQAPGNSLPVDSDLLFLRVREYDRALGGLTPEGPIFIIQPPGFYETPKPALAFSGDAPGVTAKNGELPPADSIHLFLPNFASHGEFHNLHPTNSVMVAFGRGQPMVQVTGLNFVTMPGDFNEMFIASPLTGSAVPFAVSLKIMNYGP